MIATELLADETHETPAFPRILAELEASMVDVECSLLDMLIPAQFERVQELVQATRLLTAARCMIAETERREQDEARDAAIATTCAGRPRHRARRRHHLVALSAATPSAARLS